MIGILSEDRSMIDPIELRCLHVFILRVHVVREALIMR